jgi:hypothetical protein
MPFHSKIYDLLKIVSFAKQQEHEDAAGSLARNDKNRGSSILIQSPFLPDFTDGGIHRLGEVAQGGALSSFWAGETALGGPAQFSDCPVQVMRFLQNLLRFKQDWAGGVGDARCDRA